MTISTYKIGVKTLIINSVSLLYPTVIYPVNFGVNVTPYSRCITHISLREKLLLDNVVDEQPKGASEKYNLALRQRVRYIYGLFGSAFFKSFS